jgi:3-methyladenine DNA glycosylase/8-oxoguanine DNA glycosylase
VGRLARLGRRATEDEVRAFFEPYAPFQALAGTYLLHARFA